MRVFLTRIVLASCFAAAAALLAQQSPEQPGPHSKAAEFQARHLVRQVIDNELKAEKNDQFHWMYVDRLQEPGKDDIEQVVQTNSADLKLLTVRNGRPVTSAERKKEVERLKKLASDPAEQQQAMRADREDSEKARRMLKMLPEAFIYTTENTTGDLTTLGFRPDPNFHPASREAAVFHGMAGTLIVNNRAERLVEIRGHLIDEVKFGWGVLGHLDKGGQFLVKQSEIEPGLWEISELDVQMTGKALFFKSIALHQKELRSEYRRLPDNLPPQQGLAMLMNAPSTVAQR